MTRVISVRVPSDWASLISSERAREWALAWLRDPVTMTNVPGPGALKLNLRLSDEELADLKRMSGRATSSALRGVFALNLATRPVPQERGLKWIVGGVASGIVLLLLFGAGVGPRGKG
jgi:hypothetical protein